MCRYSIFLLSMCTTKECKKYLLHIEMLSCVCVCKYMSSVFNRNKTKNRGCKGYNIIGSVKMKLVQSISIIKKNEINDIARDTCYIFYKSFYVVIII